MTVRNRKSQNLSESYTNGAVKQHDDNGKDRLGSASGWFSSNPSKAYGEKFFAIWSVIWIGMVAFVVVTRMFEDFTADSYMIFGLMVGLPCMILPFIFPGEADRQLHWTERYTTKANLYIWILSWVANYFWTHYFYSVLGARYTFPAYRLNNVPFNLYFMTQSYFAMYHTLSTILLRKLYAITSRSSRFTRFTVSSLFIFVLSYFIAFMEAYTLENFPHYNYPDAWAMYTLGSGFYCIYFLVTFPMFYRLDEHPSEPTWTLQQSAIDALAASMLVFQAIDFWRLFVGPIFVASKEDSLLTGDLPGVI